jgi:hypothetical protein
MRRGRTAPRSRSIESFQRSGEIRGKPREGKGERGAPADHHIVAAGTQTGSDGKPHNLAQPAANAITLDCPAYFPGNREADPDRTAVAAVAALHDETRRRSAYPGGGIEKIAALPQSFHGTDAEAGRRSSRTEPLAAARPASIHHEAPALGGHSGPEAMATLAHQPAWLIGPLHGYRSTPSK